MDCVIPNLYKKRLAWRSTTFEIYVECMKFAVYDRIRTSYFCISLYGISLVLYFVSLAVLLSGFKYQRWENWQMLSFARILRVWTGPAKSGGYPLNIIGSVLKKAEVWTVRLSSVAGTQKKVRSRTRHH